MSWKTELTRASPRLPKVFSSWYTFISRADSARSCPRPSCRIPIVLVKPSSRARRATATASSGFSIPLPTTELMLTPNKACSASHLSFGSSRRRLFSETASGSTLSMLIWR